eukprot:TRINITY_DN4756_c0_g2_i1.p1 TRINITY_DN4756_c0_g2~~TRINITY_DN4756_c0_g2_i1.p1  ORF type:complete len:546 (-),score=92.90 TRINITY_DN4756_c0_g2_i1:93-1730(-)
MSDFLVWKSVGCVGTVPQPRHSHATVFTNDGLLYVVGGYGDIGTYIYDVYFLDTNLEVPEWKRTINAPGQRPTPRHSHSMVFHSSSLWIYGGISSPKDVNQMNDLHRFDLLTKTWQLMPTTGNVPPLRWGHSAVLFPCPSQSSADPSSMIIFGGLASPASTFSNDVYELNFTTLVWTKRECIGVQPTPRHLHTAVLYQEKDTNPSRDENMYKSIYEGWWMYVMGGFDGVKTHTMSKLNLATNTWYPVDGPNEMIKRRGHSAVVFQNKMYVTGGRDKGNLNDCLEYDFETSKWTALYTFGNQPSKRHFHSTTIDIKRGRLWMFGGLGDKNENDVHYLTLVPTPRQPKSVSHFADLLNNPLFSDLILKVQDGEIYTHRAILYSGSDRFKAMLANGMKESSQKEIILPHVQYRVLLVLLEYIYVGTVEIPHDLIIEVLELSDEYLVEGLKNYAQEILCREVENDNLLSLLAISDKYRLANLKARCLKVLTQICSQNKNYVDSLSLDDFHTLEIIYPLIPELSKVLPNLDFNSKKAVDSDAFDNSENGV